MVIDASAYELLRQKRIQRNKELLKHLGLYDLRTPVVGPAKRAADRGALPPETERETIFRRNHERGSSVRQFAPIDAGSEPAVRRSARLLEARSEKPPDNGLSENESPAPRPEPRRRTRSSLKRFSHKENDNRIPSSINSTKQSVCNVAGLKPYLGRAIPVPPRLGGQVKRSVIEAATLTPTRPVFNRMSGICEWQNAIMLFVNLPPNECALRSAPPASQTPRMHSTYDNVFYDSGKYIVWYAQSTQGPGNQTLRRLASGAEVELSSITEILLFCRLPRPYDAGYLYFGRLEYVEHDEQTHPIQFIFRLADYDQLTGSNEPTEGCFSVFTAAIHGEYARAWQLAASV